MLYWTCTRARSYRCRRLHDYSLFIATVRQNLERGYAIKQAIRAAIKQCIHDHVLEDILLKQESEVYHMLLNEFDIERYGRTKREEGLRLPKVTLHLLNRKLKSNDYLKRTVS